MKAIKRLLIIIFLFQIVIPAQKKEIVAYYPEWGVRQQHYYVKDVETTGSAGKITVLSYAFVEPGPDTSGHVVAKFMSTYYDYQQTYPGSISVDGIADDSIQPLRGQFNQLKKLKKLHPDLKIIISLGGWTGSIYFSDAALTSASRELFVNDCIDKFIRGNLPKDNNSGGIGTAKGIFDGFDIDWEFPVEGGDTGIHHNPYDKDNFSALIELFRKRLDEINPKLLLTAAIPAGTKDLWKFNLYKDQNTLNWINLMTYDFHGGWDSVTGHHTNLFGGQQSFSNTIRYFLDTLKIKSNKIIPGAAFYGHGWKVADTINDGLFRRTVANGITGSGFNNYSDLEPLLKKGYEYNWDDSAMAPWLFNPLDSVMVSFDDTKSIALKSQYVNAHNLRGIMFWEISGDDQKGTLVNTIYNHNMPEIHLAKKISKIKIIEPLSSNVITSGSDIIIKTNINANDISLAKVEFYCDNKSLGYCTKFPFDWVWFNTPVGKHKLKVVATFDNHEKKTSPLVLINVKEKKKNKK